MEKFELFCQNFLTGEIKTKRFPTLGQPRAKLVQPWPIRDNQGIVSLGLVPNFLGGKVSVRHWLLGWLKL
jgi:hypothetical protein